MTIKKVPIAVVATILGKSEQFVRRGLIAGKLPFGIMGGLCEPCKRFITLPNSATFGVSPPSGGQYAGIAQ